MIGHYLLSAMVNLRKTPFTTAANVLTLALGLACFIGAWSLASFWRSADSYHPDADQIVFISESINAPGAARPGMMNQISSAAIAKYLKADFPEIQAIARTTTARDVAVAVDQRKALLNAAYVDPEFLDIVGLEFIEGDAAALSNPHGVVLTQDAARRLFGDRPALGRPVIVNAQLDAVVTGVIAPVRQPSFMGADGRATLRFDMMQPWGAGPYGPQLDASDNWLQMSGYTIARLAPGASLEAFRQKLPGFLTRRLPPQQAQLATVFLDAFPIGRIWTLGLENSLFPGAGRYLSVVSLVIGLGVLLLGVACVNYANLASAQAMSGAREVGMRKALGAGRLGVMAQAWTAALLQTLSALAAGLALLVVIAPPIRTATGNDILFAFSNGPAVALSLATLVAAVTLVAGAYPALVLSGARPAEALRSGASRSGPRRIAQVLVGVQFASVSFLLILVVVTQLQRQEMERYALASQDEPVVALNPLAPLGIDFETLADRLRRSPGVQSVTVAEYAPWSLQQNIITLARSPEPGANVPPVFLRGVGYDFFQTLDLELLAGRVFERERDATPTDLIFGVSAEAPPIVIDRAYAERLGFASPETAVGQIIYVPQRARAAVGLSAQPVRIIGVTERDTTRLEASEVVGHAYVFAPSSPIGAQVPLVRLSSAETDRGLAAVERTWAEIAPNVPLQIHFFDDLFEQSYRAHARANQTFAILAVAAFFISTTGLLGIAVHVAARRRHEIAVRKTLGSTTWGAVRLLLTDFSKPVIVANLIAWPLGYLAAETYLSAFAHRIDLTLWPFALSMAITLAIAWLAVGGQTFKAASVRPAQVLRSA